MLFTSLKFPLFFILFTSLYYLLPRMGRRVWLFFASCVFYAAAVPEYLSILFFLITVDYAAGIWIEQAPEKRKKLFLWLSILVNLGTLFIFKYYDFFNSNLSEIFRWVGLTYHPTRFPWVLPLGLSFHTFQSLSYIIEVYWGRQKAERNFLTYGLYVMFWPQLVAGPIERPQGILKQLHFLDLPNRTNIITGLRLILLGLAKKLLVADRLARDIAPLFASPENYSSADLLIGSLFFTFQIYCDFSGYTDIARGCARILGVELMKNFDAPLLSASLTEFWKRWHISLSSWFKDYVYTPLFFSNSLSRIDSPKIRQAICLLVIFALSGLWHGANWTYVWWGLLHGVGLSILVFFPAKKKGPKTETQWLWGVVCTLFWVSLAGVFFRAASLTEALRYLSCTVTAWYHSGSHDAWLGVTQRMSRALLLFGVLVVEYGQSRRPQLKDYAFNLPRVLRIGAYYAAIALILFWGVYEERQFIYFQF